MDWSTGVTISEPPVSAVICVLQERQHVRAGPLSTAGYVFAGGDRQIEQVEVSIDGGAHWETAQLVGEARPWTWRFWEAPLRLRPSRQHIIVRARESAGASQPIWPQCGIFTDT